MLLKGSVSFIFCPVFLQYVSEVVIGAPYAVGKDLLDHFKVGFLPTGLSYSYFIYFMEVLTRTVLTYYLNHNSMLKRSDFNMSLLKL